MRPPRCPALWLWAGILFSHPLFGQADCPPLTELRTAVLGHGTLQQALDSRVLAERHLEDRIGPCATVIEAHRWVSHARSADFEWNPATKLSRLNTGLDSLNALVALHPDLDILKALRLTITGTAPRFLGVNGDWPEDRAATQRLLDVDHWAESPKFSVWMADLLEQTD